MRFIRLATAAALGLFVSFAGHAAAPANAPAGTTGLCKDGTFSSATSKRGACRGHQGVQDWYAADAAAAAPAVAAASKAAPAVARPAVPVAAAAATAAPAGSTGVCRDGSYTNAASKRGACRGHQGVQQWYDKPAGSAPAATKPAPAAAPAAATAPAVAAPAAAARPAPAAAPTPAAPKAAGAPGPGMVWANARTKVYHCQGDRWYGKTKEGAYMTQAQAEAQGIRPSQGKACAVN